MELFTNETIEQYKCYFNIPKVMDEANKIFDVVKKSEELNKEEKIASIILAYLKYGEYCNNKNK